MQRFFAPGKLLLSGEYSVLQGAKAVSIPTRYGQHLQAEKHAGADLHYRALDDKGEAWLDFKLSEAKLPEEMLLKNILLSHADFSDLQGWKLESRLDFPREWGLGSSSTFISLIAKWLNTDVWPLFFEHLKGSGYDVAVAESQQEIIYELKSPKGPYWENAKLPDFFDSTYFVYLGQKQNSAAEVKRYLQNQHPKALIQSLSALSEQLLKLRSISDLEAWMLEHEKLTSMLIGRKPIPPQVLPEFGGVAKSLGAWGGDFLWLSKVEDPQVLIDKGFETIIPYKDMKALT